MNDLGVDMSFVIHAAQNGKTRNNNVNASSGTKGILFAHLGSQMTSLKTICFSEMMATMTTCWLTTFLATMTKKNLTTWIMTGL